MTRRSAPKSDARDSSKSSTSMSPEVSLSGLAAMPRRESAAATCAALAAGAATPGAGVRHHEHRPAAAQHDLLRPQSDAACEPRIGVGLADDNEVVQRRLGNRAAGLVGFAENPFALQLALRQRLAKGRAGGGRLAP